MKNFIIIYDGKFKQCLTAQSRASLFKKYPYLYKGYVVIEDTPQNLLKEIEDWTTKTFPLQTVESKMSHLQDEIDEILQNPTDLYEWADAFMLLVDAARINGISYSRLLSCVREKFEVNKTRKWGKPNKKGVIYHE